MKSKIDEANEKIADVVTTGFQKIQDGVVNGYKKIENGVVKEFSKIEDSFISRYLLKEGESLDEAKERIKREEQERKINQLTGDRK